MLDIKGRSITLIGSKRSALASGQLVVDLGGIPRISEACQECELTSEAKEWIDRYHVEIEFGGHTLDFIAKSDVVVLSPGVRIDADVVRMARSASVPVLGEIEFAFQFCHKPVIAITGSNGKTTVATLMQQVLEQAGYRSVLCGNVGQPFSQFVCDLSDKDFVVLEVSSFQMESLIVMAGRHRKPGQLVFKGFKPYVATLLNFSENHLDRHKDLEEYFEAKAQIFLNQDQDDYAVLSSLYPEFRKLLKQLQGQVYFFDDEIDGSDKDLNLNQKAVCQMADILGIERSTCHAVFDKFPGVEHRLEFVRKLDGADYINDSKATTVEAGRWALANFNKPVVMICGGRDKNLDFTVLKEIVGRKVKAMIVYGEARDKLKSTFTDIVVVESCDDLSAAVQKAHDIAEDGDCVVLSPMCASFDQFADYEERGRTFKKCVNELTSHVTLE